MFKIELRACHLLKNEKEYNKKTRILLDLRICFQLIFLEAVTIIIIFETEVNI